MGNRAVVTFDKAPTNRSVGVYLHWNGGVESVYAFLQACDRFKVRDDTDASYQLARFVQIVSNYLGGTTSIGVGRLEELDLDNGDNGVYKVSRTVEGITIEHSPTGKLRGPWVKVDLKAVKSEDILTEAIKKNTQAFDGKE